MGFAKPFNPDARATYREAVAKIAAMLTKPDFIIHTGGVSQLSKDSQFDDADQIIKEAGLPVFHVPGKHDMLDEGSGAAFLARYGKGSKGAGWYSFNHAGVFNSKVDFPPPVADLVAQGYPLVGGRLDHVDGRDVAAIVYRRRAHVINLFVWKGAGPATPTLERREGYYAAATR